MTVIAIANQKGGTGKTSTSVHLAYWLTHIRNHKVLLVDADSQQSSSFWLHKFEGNRDLQIPYQIMTVPDELFLNLEVLKTEYEYVVIDAPASMETMTQRAIDSADLALIPVKPGELELHSVNKVLSKIRITRKLRGKPHPDAAVFFSMGDPRATTVMSESRAWFASHASDVRLLQSPIYERNVIKDAPGQDCTVWQVDSPAAKKAILEYETMFTEALSEQNGN